MVLVGMDDVVCVYMLMNRCVSLGSGSARVLVPHGKPLVPCGRLSACT
jgi:hypothetical protein